MVFNIPVFARYDVVTLCASNTSLSGHTANISTGPSARASTTPVSNHQTSRYQAETIVLKSPTQSHSGINLTSKALSDTSGEDYYKRVMTGKQTRVLDKVLSTVSLTHVQENGQLLLYDRNVSIQNPQSVLQAGRIWLTVRYTAKHRLLMNNETIDTIYSYLWLVVGNLVPLILLIIFNVCIFRVVYQSVKLRRQFSRQNQVQAKSASTLTLMLIVLLFFILVAPSELVLHLSRRFNGGTTPKHKTIELILNLMQTVNFSINFILYCLINPHFRQTLKFIFMCGFRDTSKITVPSEGILLNAETTLIDNRTSLKTDVL